MELTDEQKQARRPILLLIFAVLFLGAPVNAFAPSQCRRNRLLHDDRSIIAPTSSRHNHHSRIDKSNVLLRLSDSQPDPNKEEEEDDDTDSNVLQKSNKDIDTDDALSNILQRFTNPRIDDPALPLADVLVAQVIAPSLQVGWLFVNQAPLPTWLKPLFASSAFASFRGSLVAPALIHGAALAVCWVFGALAARAYEVDGIVMGDVVVEDTSESRAKLEQQSEKTLAPVILTVVKAGAFATGLLIFSTQIDLFLEFGGRYVQYGDSAATDFRLQVAAVELVNDVFFEAVSLLVWRVYLAVQTERNRL